MGTRDCRAGNLEVVMSEMRAAASSGGGALPSESGAEQPEYILLLWHSRVKLLLNPHVWSMVILGFAATGAILALIFGLASGSASAGLTMGAGGFAFLLVVFVATGTVVDLFGGFRVAFSLTTHGVRSARGKGANAVSTIATVGGILAANAAAVGAGLLSQSERNVFIAYTDVRKVKVCSSGRYILVRGGFGEKPIGLYCEADVSRRVLDVLRLRCPSARFLGPGA